MTFVAWHYRNGHYVRSHYRRRPWRRAITGTPPLFAVAGGLGRGGPEPATAVTGGAASARRTA